MSIPSHSRKTHGIVKLYENATLKEIKRALQSRGIITYNLPNVLET